MPGLSRSRPYAAFAAGLHEGAPSGATPGRALSGEYLFEGHCGYECPSRPPPLRTPLCPTGQRGVRRSTGSSVFVIAHAFSLPRCPSALAIVKERTFRNEGREDGRPQARSSGNPCATPRPPVRRFWPSGRDVSQLPAKMTPRRMGDVGGAFPSPPSVMFRLPVDDEGKHVSFRDIGIYLPSAACRAHYQNRTSRA